MAIIDNYYNVKNKIDASGRDVKLVVVTKTHPVDMINEVVREGASDLGENRVQELLEKYGKVESSPNWHLIGHLQSNKVKYIIDKVTMIHSLDSLGLAAEINKQGSKIDRIIPCLVQVNIADDDNKYGLSKDDVVKFLSEMSQYPFIKIKGLMTIGPFYSNPEDTRWVFKELRELRDSVAGLKLPNIDMIELSMGMSNDYLVAIDEGATMVRVGSSIFGAR